VNYSKSDSFAVERIILTLLTVLLIAALAYAFISYRS
jgi:cell division protein FtsL